MICQPFNKNVTPRGSYTLLKAASKPRLIDRLSSILILKTRVSFSKFYLTPEGLSSGKIPIARSLFLTPS